MAHVELSISEPLVPQAREPMEPMRTDNFQLWVATAAVALEPCLVIDQDYRIVAASRSCCELLGLGDPGTVEGSPLLAGLRLVDFTAARSELDETEIDKIPPLLALTSGRLARGLLRVATAIVDGQGDGTVDAVATPVWSGNKVAGSLTFFAPISTAFSAS
ncbi:hypothetical protein O7623_19625 [Solwaraspora sp. WMMD791]|uniref:hypothetical protein n=1 Tax=Solwaraspora sp. WMMD791 TaxID=3016086 RepID=UPI00249AC6EF|nr:hypothetical protein [Solwaraspora sp. WMMD791]WFE25585.1 hypothetical protein O7623_19625 [Solwaraspora sp. WMMD791]